LWLVRAEIKNEARLTATGVAKGLKLLARSLATFIAWGQSGDTAKMSRRNTWKHVEIRGQFGDTQIRKGPDFRDRAFHKSLILVGGAGIEPATPAV
jgi:hypothetical protein